VAEPSVRIEYSAGAGRGVFANRDFEAGDEIEACPVIVIDAADVARISESVLGHYVYGWDDGGVAVALGFGSLYNHSDDNNAAYYMGDDEASLVIVAEKPIAAGEEILIDYTGGGETDLWFTPRPSNSG
jgi:hypothetical protein